MSMVHHVMVLGQYPMFNQQRLQLKMLKANLKKTVLCLVLVIRMYLVRLLMLILHQNSQLTWQNMCRKLMFKMVIPPKFIKVVLTSTKTCKKPCTQYQLRFKARINYDKEWAQLDKELAQLKSSSPALVWESLKSVIG